MDVITSFDYNYPKFVRKIQVSWTSNHIEYLHSVLWAMVHKNETMSTKLWNFGSALSLITYNEDYNGILTLFSSIGVNTTGNLETLLQEFDNKRILKSSNTIREQKGYAKKLLMEESYEPVEKRSRGLCFR